jgi:hypothetical protein
MLLAAAVNSAAAQGPAAAGLPVAPSLSWVMRGDTQAAGAYLARKAATTIRSLDRLSGAQPARACFSLATAQLARPAVPQVSFNRPAELPARGTHQHSAP